MLNARAERNTLDVYANNEKLEVVPQFCEDSDGSEMHFNVQTEGERAARAAAALEHWSSGALDSASWLSTH